ncbi:hypothetical protein N7471_007864 [Penicillium samsonianum]|uniref:uncharacterized protein n=1 Tax=Penicillium samsonianum TaxID=1882272 RepID=UPI00254858AB|nr:uncharacterized protein N7471_007864 [Penicillium samsonianum]KAJ6132649.1 hypothetical protein N7471_007864 [Penicillium samsonianum]
MAGWWFMFHWVLAPSFANAGVINLAKRTVLSDLSGGFCRSYRFGADIANNFLYMVGLDGGLIPDDGDASNNYLVTLDLTSSFSTSEGKNYKMTKIDPDTVKEKLWGKQDGTIQPSRLEYGVYTNAPAIQAGFWIGGYRDSGTTPSITDSTKEYGTGLIQLNTTTGQYTSLDGPYEAVQEGSLSYVPVGDGGILVYIGGDVPSIKDGINATMSSNSWSHVQVYDIAGAKWYNQSTTGTVASRTQFCASVQHDESSPSYQIYVLGGANLKSKDTILDVNYLSIPSFKWYSAPPLDDPRMTLTCVTYGRQIFGIGGRRAWADDGKAGCYDTPAFIYDAQSEATRSSFDPALSSFSLSSSTASDIKASPSPLPWADPAFKSLFGKSEVATSTTANNEPSSTSESKKVSTSDPAIRGAIAGGVVGGVAGLALIIGLLWFFISRNKKQKNVKLGEAEIVIRPVQPMPELPGGARDGRSELRRDTYMYLELPADNKREISKLDSEWNR